jgi:hypothetical protein
VDPVRIAERQNGVIEIGEFLDCAMFDAGLAQMKALEWLRNRKD